ncbi:MAG: hypothetical protein ACYTA3_03165 [Planctomycetota bacterium]
MGAFVEGRLDWNLNRDKDGHRTYKVKWLVQTTSTADGPSHALIASGLPAIGSSWNQGNDYDAWARCWPTMACRYITRNERGRWWEVEQTFTTKPLSRCQDTTIENPLNEPDRISGGFTKYTQEVTQDRNGDEIKNSAEEAFRGPQVEFDNNRPTVTIEKNVLTLDLATISEMVDTVNDATLWGLAARKVKLSNVSWSRELYGTCTFYYKISYEFDINFETFDRTVIDIGTRFKIKGAVANDKNQFERYRDINGELTTCHLDGNGNLLPAGDDPVEIDIEYYDESNFLTLGIPSSL